MPKRKTHMSETIEFLRQHIDLRTEWGKKAWETIQKYIKKKDTSKLSLLKGLAIEFPERPFVEVLNVDLVDYQKNVKARCICGQRLSKEVYRIRIRGVSRKKGLESQINGKIKEQVPVSTLSRSSKVEFLLGKDCFAHFPDLLNDFGYDNMQKTIKEAKNKKRKELEDIVEVSTELEKQLKRKGIDPEQFRKINELIKESATFNDKSALFELDPGKKNSFANWFKEGIKNRSIDNEEIINAYNKLENAAHLLSTEELVALTLYSYEYRQFETRAVIGIIKDDLLYLAEKGEVNLDKHYVRPATRFRSREDLEKVTIREKLEQSHITFLEALGIKLHFPEIEKRRIELNREIADKYGVGRSWNYILKEIGPVFEETKEELAADYKKFGEIVREFVLTKEEYLTVKDFFKRSKMGRGTERENYLGMFSIRKFKNVAPVIVSVGRKIRYARRKFDETEDEWLKQEIIKQKYILKEDLENRFEELTGIKEKPEKVIDAIVNAQLVQNKNFSKFQNEHGKQIKEAYENGLFAKKYLDALKRHFDALKKEKVLELDEETKAKLAKIVKYSKSEFVSIEYTGKLEKGLESVKLGERSYLPEKFIEVIKRVYSDLKNVLEHTKLEETDLKEFAKKKAALESKGKILYVEEGGYGLNERCYSAKEMKITDESIIPIMTSKSNKGYQIKADDIKGIEEAVKKIESGIEVDEEFLKKIDLLNEKDIKVVGIEKSFYSYYLRHCRREFNKIIFSKQLKEKVEEAYKKIQEYAQSPEYHSVEKRKEMWKRERWGLVERLRNKIFNNLVKDNAELWQVINGTIGGYLSGPKGAKILFRKPKYVVERPRQYTDLMYKRFMGDGVNFLDWSGLASGRIAKFTIHPKIKGYLKEDLEKGIIDSGQYEEYLKRLKKFEEDVNKIIQEI